MGARVAVDTGYLLDGTKFDSSYDNDEAFGFRIGKGKVIAGWESIAAGMPVGDSADTPVPSCLGTYVLYVRATRTSLLRAVRARAACPGEGTTVCIRTYHLGRTVRSAYRGTPGGQEGHRQDPTRVCIRKERDTGRSDPA